MPTNATEVRQLVGAAQFFRRWIPGFSSMVAPLTDMLKKGVDFKTEFGDDQRKAVQDIKRALTASECLAMYDPNKPCIILVDASTIGIGGCLAQQHEGHLRPVSYTSPSRTTPSLSLQPIRMTGSVGPRQLQSRGTAARLGPHEATAQPFPLLFTTGVSGAVPGRRQPPTIAMHASSLYSGKPGMLHQCRATLRSTRTCTHLPLLDILYLHNVPGSTVHVGSTLYSRSR